MASLETQILSIPGAGRRTLLAALGQTPELPEGLCLCLLDAGRSDAPEQIQLLDELARQGAKALFVLNKCDLTNPRNAVGRSLALLRERGFDQPELYPVCAQAARLLRLPTQGRELTEAEQTALTDAFYRYAPGDNSLSALAVTGDLSCSIGGRELSPEQLRLALINTGLPALEARLRELAETPAAAEPVSQAPAPAENAQEAEQETAAPEPAAQEPAAPEPETEALREEGLPVREEAMKALLEEAETADCAGLLKLAREVQGGEAPDDWKEQALDALHDAYQARQLTELRALTLDADKLEQEELRTLLDRITTGPYTVQTRAPYVELLTHRMDELHSVALEELCAGVEEADSRTLTKIRSAVAAMDCAEILKNDCYRRIEERQDALDLEALDRVTAGAETMTEKELRAVAVTLEADNWNPKYVTGYRHRIDLLREAATAKELQGELAELNVMERREVLALRERIQGKELPNRFTAAPLAQIDQRLYRLDMLRLMALNNDFDLLDFEGIDNLRTQVARGDYCEAARRTYLGRLLERENALILQNTAPRAELTRQLIGQHKMRMSDFTFAAASGDYQDALAAFWGGSGMEQPRDLPVFLFDNASDYAFSGQRFWYKSGRDLAFVPLEEIDHLQVMKQRLTMNLQIVRKDNTYLLTEAKLSRMGLERTLDFLNDCLRRWFDPGMAQGLSANPIRTRRFETGEFSDPVEPGVPNADTALEGLKAAFAAGKLREGNLIREGEESWNQRTRRLLQNFELPENTPLVWYCSASILGSVREGVALGPKAIYVKESRLPTKTIPLLEIYSIQRGGNKRVDLSTVQNQSYGLEISGDLAPVLADYVRTIQLGALLAAERGL